MRAGGAAGPAVAAGHPPHPLPPSPSPVGAARGNCRRRESAEFGLTAAPHGPGPALLRGGSSPHSPPSTPRGDRSPAKGKHTEPRLGRLRVRKCGSQSLFNGESGRIYPSICLKIRTSGDCPSEVFSVPGEVF